MSAHQHLSCRGTPSFLPFLDHSCSLCSQLLNPLAPVGNLLHAVFASPHLHHHSAHLHMTLAQELHDLGLSLYNLDEQSILSLALASPPDLTTKDRTAWLLHVALAAAKFALSVYTHLEPYLYTDITLFQHEQHACHSKLVPTRT